MSCDHELLSAWFDGATNETESDKVEHHLESCPSCRQWINELTLLAQELCEDESPEPLSNNTVRHILAACPEPPAPGLLNLWRSFWNCQIQIPLPALAMCLMLLALLLGHTGSKTNSVPLELPSSRQQLALVTPPKIMKSSPVIQTVIYDPLEAEQEAPVMAVPPPPPFFSRRPRGRWVVLEERYERSSPHKGRVY